MVMHISDKIRKFLLFFGGLLTGVILLFAISYIRTCNNHGPCIDIFEKPVQVISISDFRVIQVFDDGSALATADYSVSGDPSNIGVAVLFPVPEEGAYYDEQKIHIEEDKVLKQIGVFRYVNRQNVEKTVPVVKEFEK